MGDDDEFMEGLEPEEDEWQDEADDFGSKKRKRQAANKQANKKSQRGKWENAFDEKGNDLSEPKPEKKKRVPKPKEVKDPNKIKTQNKLVGDIINKEYYLDQDSDDDFLITGNERDQLFGGDMRTGGAFRAPNDELKNVPLDLGTAQPRKKIDLKDLLAQRRNKNQNGATSSLADSNKGMI